MRIYSQTLPPRDMARGMTLIELMISIVLGLLLVAVVIQIYVGSKSTYNKQEDLSRLQENGRVAIDVIGRMARVSGFKSNPAADYSTIFPTSAPAITGTAGVAGSSDSLTIRFQGSGTGAGGAGAADGSVVDCLGVTYDSNVTIFNRLYVANNATTTRPGVFCDTTNDSTVNGTEVVSEIENMRILYGVDISGDGIVDYYVPAGLVGNFDQVASLRIGLVAATPNLINPTLDTRTYNVVGITYDPIDDRRSRRLYSMTIALRMRTP